MASRLGIVAGRGDLPARLIAACRAVGRDYYVLALEEQTDRSTVQDAPHDWVRLGAGAQALELLRRAGVRDLVFAGAVRRPSLMAIRPDALTARFLAEVGLRAFGDDSLLRLILARFEQEGFQVLSPETLLDELLAPQGTFGAVTPDIDAERDIARGVAVARALGAVDVGQAIVVQQGIVLAVEAAEGTDEMIARAGTLRREGPGGVLVKVSKPGQDRRVDLPVIGPETVRRAAAAGLRGIAVEAGATLVIDRPAVIREADASGVFLVGLVAASAG